MYQAREINPQKRYQINKENTEPIGPVLRLVGLFFIFQKL